MNPSPANQPPRDPPTATPGDPTTAATPSRRRRIAHRLGRLSAVGLALLILAGGLGQALRDRSTATTLLMYLPLPLLAGCAVALDAAWRGRSLGWPGFALTALALIAAGWSAWWLIGSGREHPATPGEREVSVLHWNVQWGGGLFRGPRSWAAQRAAILARHPDLIVLSEAPPRDWLDQLVAELGPGASLITIQHHPSSPYWYRLAVISRRPLRQEPAPSLPNGSALVVVAEVDGRDLRLLIVDGLSSPTRPRLPFLAAIAESCRRARANDRPFDLVLGDFNTPSRSLGFDELEALGYTLAGRSAHGWRATFPAWLPVYDIDHVWLAPGMTLASCSFFNGPHTDHRGQHIRILEKPKNDSSPSMHSNGNPSARGTTNNTKSHENDRINNLGNAYLNSDILSILCALCSYFLGSR
ncbi:MAG: endonuclease/exonuclease/phosphatase family protein [Isosphaeraceae bacterium]